MKNYISLLCIAALGITILASCSSEKPPQMQSKNMYDTAMKMLYEFVEQSNDTNLGFSSAAEVLKAHIAVDSGIDMYILGKGNILQAKGDSQELDLHIQMKKLSRKIYPVCIGSQPHAAITFDSVNGAWFPVIFENANALIPYYLDMQIPSNTGKTWKQYYLATSGDLHDDVIFRKDSSGEYALPTSSIKKIMAGNYPDSGSALRPIRKEDFFEGLKKHVQKRLRGKNIRLASLSKGRHNP